MPARPPASPHPEECLAGGGEMGALMRAVDWAATPLGPVESWPTSLRTMVGVVLASRFPMLLWWGPQLIQLYNDAYRPVLGDKHPRSLAAPGREVWAEIWDVLGPLAEGVYRGGPSTWNDDLLLLMNRRGFVEETYFSFSYSAVRDDDGGVGGVLVTCAENTERVQGERQLRMLRDLAAHAAGAKTAEGACATAARILAANDADLPFALLYLSDGDRVRLVADAGLAGRDAPTGWPFAEAAASGLAIVEDLRARFGPLPGGRWEAPPERAVVLPLLRSGAGGPYGFLVAGVSPRRALDERYLGLYRLTAEHVATAIANARAAEEDRQRVEALAAIDRAKTLFFSNISHEFRTPLTLILGPIEDAMGRGGGLAGGDLEIAHRNALRLLKLVNALLDFSRIEAGRAQARYAPTDLARLTAELAAVFRAAVERAGLSYVVDVAPLAGPVYVDRDMWEQIVLNLLSNAVKFTFEGRIEVLLRDAGDGVELTVRDSGVGVAPEELPRLFERFHRVEGARARTHEGSGIGLALVHDLVALHGGTITADSQLGRGSTFRVRLPRGPAHLPAEQIVAATPLSSEPVRGEAFVGEALRWIHGEAPEAPAGARGAERVLVVDDNADMRDYLVRLLEPHVRVTAVTHGGEALAAARREPPDLVITDVMMPVLDGIGLTRALRADPATRGVPVIMLSARAGEEARLAGLDAGADDYLGKPFSARELLARARVQLSLARTRRQLEHERNHLRRLLQSAPVAISFLRGPELVIEIAHDAVARTFGGRALEGRPLLEAVPELAAYDYPAKLRRVYETGVPLTGRAAPLVLLRDGVPVETYWDYAYLPVRDADGGIEGVMTCDVDVTEQVLARRAVDEANQRLAAALDAAHAGTWRSDLTTGVATRDAGLNRILGLPAVESRQPAGDFLERVHPDDRERVRAEVARCVRDGGSYAGEHRVVRPSGEVRWIQVHGRVVADRAGAPRVLTGAVVDVTDRKRAEAVIVASEGRLRAALDAAAIGTYLWDVRAGTVVNDEGVRRLFGFGPGEGQRLEEYTARIHEEDRPRWLAELERCARDGSDFSLEMRVVLPDGTIRWLHDKGRMARDAEGRAQTLAGAVVDVTERRLLAERAEEARARAEEANRAKDEFLAMLGHELRNPLAPIVTALQLMKLRGDGKTSREQQIIERQTQHLVRLVDDLLDVSRIARGKVALRREEVDLRDVVAKAVEIASPLLEQRQHRFSVEVPPVGLRVSGDPVRLAQVVANLLTNAARYTPVGGNVVLAVAREGDELVLRVSDDGIGMSAELLPRVFDLFVQGHRDADRAEGGLGLGLTLVSNLVGLHGGSVAAASEGPGRGSTFTVRLPALAAQPPAAPDAPRPEPAAERKVTGRRVLVVDDNVDAASTLSEALATAGHEVAVAHDGVQALELVRRFRPDVAVLDIGLPVLDGYEVARRMRQVLAPEELPRLIAVTGYGQERDRQRSGTAGFEQHLVKPVDLGRLLEVITA